VPTRVVFRGLAPFIFMDILRILLMIAVPSIALVLPSRM
jgi:TRAP-type C4-dicarboxylate transport system permease large subunit